MGSLLNEYIKKKEKKQIAPIAPTNKQKADLVKMIASDPLQSKLHSEIAPISAGSDSWVTPGSFSDGYQLGDVIIGATNTVVDAGSSALQGLLQTGEGVTDLLLYGTSGIADLAGYDSFAKETKEWAMKDVTAESFDIMRSKGDPGMTIYDNSFLGNKSRGVGQAIGQVAGMYLTGGLGTAAGLGSVGISALNTGIIGLSAMGSGMSEAYSMGLSDGEAVAYGATVGTIEAISEMIFGGLGKGVKALGVSKGLTSIDDVLAKKISNIAAKFITSEAGQRVIGNTLEYAVKSGAEGLEEVIAGFGSAIAKDVYLYNGKNERAFSEIRKDENLLEQFVVGSIVSGIAQGGDFIKSTKNDRDFVSGLSKNEQTVVDKIFEQRLAEESENRTLTNRDKNKLYDRVVEEMKRGYVSTDEIESILGGKTYEGYKSLTEKKTSLEERKIAIEKELEDLLKTPELQFTVGQRQKYNALTEEAKDIDEFLANPGIDEAKNNLFNEVNKLTSKDTYLRESYNDLIRQTQDIQIDENKYKGTKFEDAAKKTIANARKAGASNSNRVRDFVEFAAKYSSVSGTVVDFKDDAQIKQTLENQLKAEIATLSKSTTAENKAKLAEIQDMLKQVQEGKIRVNGVKTKDGVAINIKSPNYLNTVLGHEVTHFLEGKKAYEALQKAAFKYAQTKGDYEGRRKVLDALYKNIDGTSVDYELTADLVGDYLFTEYDFIKNLSTENRNVFQYVFDQIKYMFKLATAGSREARELEKVMHNFEKALRESAQEGNKADGKNQFSIKATEDGTKYVKLDGNIFLKEDGTEMSPSEAYNALVGKKITLQDGDVITFIKRLPDVKLYYELFRKYPGHDGSIDIKSLNQAINKNIVDVFTVSDAKERNEKQNHEHEGIVDFDLREVYIVDDSDTYRLELYVANLTDGGKVAYVKRYIERADSETAEKIKKAETAWQTHLNQPSDVEGVETTDTTSTDDSIAQLSENVNTQFSLSTDKKKADADYMFAVENGDIETAQRMVDAAAREAGYSVRAYHGTPDARVDYKQDSFFTVFDHSKSNARKAFDVAHYFGTNEKLAKFYAYTSYNRTSKYSQPKVYDGYLNLGKTLVVQGNGAKWNHIPIPEGIPQRVGHWTDPGPFDYANTDYITKKAKELGYDSVSFLDIIDGDASDESYRGDVYAVFDSNQIKSADPVTYDKDGNVIPLSERFNTANKDIRYSLSKDIENFDNSWYNEVELPTENNKNYAGGKNSGDQNTELLAGREVSAVSGSGNSVWQQGGNSAKLARYLGQNSEFERKVPKGCRAGESGWILQKDNSQSGQAGHTVSLLRRISRVVPSGKDTIGRRISSEISEKFANTVFKDEDGNLLSLYHWTTAEFEGFAKGEFGFHFGTLDAAHDRYSADKEENADTPRGNYKEVFLNITNPIELSDNLGEWEAGWVARQLVDMGIITEHQYDLLSLTTGFYETTYDNPAAEAVRDILEGNGYDGIIYRNESEDVGSFSVIALHPEQILTVAENGVLKENSGVIDDTNDIAPINEASSESDAFFDGEKQYSLSGEGENRTLGGSYRFDGKDFRVKSEQDIAPIAPLPQNDEAAIIAPIAEEYEAVEQPKSAERRTDENPRVAKVLPSRPDVTEEKSNILTTIRANWFDKGAVIEDLALKTRNRELDAKYNFMRYSESRAQKYIGENLMPIVEMAEKSGKRNELETYANHLLNIDRMSLASNAKATIAKLQGKFGHLRTDQIQAIAAKEITEKTTERTANTIREAREYLRAFEVENKPVFGDTVTADASREFVKKFEAENPEAKEFSEAVIAYNAELRKMLVDGGIISQETADLWAKQYPHYVPIRRAGKDGNAINVPLDTMRTGVNAPIKKATGGDSDIESLLDTMAMRTEQTFKAIARNNFGTELLHTLEPTSHSENASVDEVFDSFDNNEELLQEGKRGANPTFTVFEDGKRVTFEISEDMYNALKPTSKGLSYTNKIANGASEIFRGLLTEYNPVFATTNAIKDVQDILLNSQHAEATYAKIPKAIAELVSKGKWYEEYIKNGGEQNTYFDSHKNTFKAEDNIFKKIIGIPFRKISELNNFIERVPRLSEYIASREAGASIETAMLDAARVTTNFAAGGDYTKFLNRNGFTFLNASVQGFNQNVRNIREAKTGGLKGVLTLAAKITAAGLPALLLNNLLWDDDEEYEELSDYVKQNYYVVAKYGDGQFVRIPKGRAIAVIQNAFEQMENLVTGDDELDLATFGELLVSNLAPNNPLENNILAPIIQTHTNKTWYGEELVPQRLQKLPNEEQYDETTDAISKWLGEKTGLSPYRLNYLLDQYSGGVGDVFLPMLTPKAERGDNSLAGNLVAPYKDKFTTDGVMNNQNVSDFYDTVDKLTVGANASGATDEDILKSKYINSISSEIGKLYGEKREIQNSDFADDFKYESAREIQEEINALARESLNTYGVVFFEGEYARVGDRVFKKNDEGEWQKLSDEQVTKYEVTSAAGDAHYATDGTNHYRWYVKDGETAGEWRKLTEKQLEKQKEVTSGLGISPKDYWGNKDEYDFAYDYPGKYAISKAIGGYNSYKSYLSEIGDIADSNDSSSGVKDKDLIMDYINNLDIDYGEKIILYRSKYSSKEDRNNYNSDIIDYLNSRDDISYEEMVTILRELDMTVDHEGNIYWD